MVFSAICFTCGFGTILSARGFFNGLFGQVGSYVTPGDYSDNGMVFGVIITWGYGVITIRGEDVGATM